MFTVKTDLFEAKINTLGGVIEEVALKEHRDAADKSKPYLVLQRTRTRTHVAQSGLIGAGLPNHTTVYSKVSSNLILAAPSRSVRLSAPIASGGKADLVYAFKRGSYVVDVTYDITNGGTAALSPAAYFHLHRDTRSPAARTAWSASSTGRRSVYRAGQIQEGRLGTSKGQEGPLHRRRRQTAGWHGRALLRQCLAAQGWQQARVLHHQGRWRSLSRRPENAGRRHRRGRHQARSACLYMGAAEQDRLKAAATGRIWWWTTACSLHRSTHVLAAALVPQHGGQLGLGIVLLTILIKAVFYLLNAAAGRSMGKMKLVGPKMKELQTRYADDRVKAQSGDDGALQERKINPLGGCLPIVIQIPVFIALYWVLIAAVELRHAPWIGWIMISGRIPFLCCRAVRHHRLRASKLQPPAPGMDPIQQKVLQYMPVAFAVMFVFFPAGPGALLDGLEHPAIAQQWQINRMLERDNAAAAAAAKAALLDGVTK